MTRRKHGTDAGNRWIGLTLPLLDSFWTTLIGALERLLWRHNPSFASSASYYVVPSDPALMLGYTDYIQVFTAALASGYVIATQFHPEKSAHAGLKLLENFLAWN